MSELLLTYAEPVSDAGGTYIARAVGRQAADRMWEGWIEFLPVKGEGDVLVSAIESRQPEREHLAYWATGLSPVYLEGALHRARMPVTVRIRAEGPPVSDAPARRVVHSTRSAYAGPSPILDPFEVGARNLDVLRQELTALNRPRLLNIIEAYDLNPAHEDIDWMTTAQLVHFIVVAVDTQLPQRLRL
jgi:hypothetical protein